MLMLLSSLLEELPKTVLSAIILAAFLPLMGEILHAFKMWKFNKFECLVYLATFIVTIIFDSVPGLLVGLGLSFVYLIWLFGKSCYDNMLMLKVNNMRWWQFVWIDFRAKIRTRKEQFSSIYIIILFWIEAIFIKPNGSINFLNAKFYYNQIAEFLNAHKNVYHPCTRMCLNMQSVHFIDHTGMLYFQDIIAFSEDHGITLYVCGLSDKLKEQFKIYDVNSFLDESSIFEDLGSLNVYLFFFILSIEILRIS